MKPTPADSVVREAPISMLIPIWIAALACIWFGLNTDMTLSAAKAAAQGLLAGSAGMMN